MRQEKNRKLNMKMQARQPHQFITVSIDQFVLKLMMFKNELKKNGNMFAFGFRLFDNFYFCKSNV